MRLNRRQILMAALASAGLSTTVIAAFFKKVLAAPVDQQQLKNSTVKLAAVESVKIIAPALLEVVAQRSGFNWELHIAVAEHQNQPEYWPYQVVEIKKGPDWSPRLGIGPVLVPIKLQANVTKTGTKGIAVVGSNKTIHLDYQLS
jgi:hypothetical protein